MSKSNEIRFDDGAGYERYMGIWSQRVGVAFLDWLAPEKGLRWLDVGCGNGAFTELFVGRCAPSAVCGIDPSEAQLEYARQRPALRGAEFRPGDAMALPYGAAQFDVAVMPLVIFFVPQPLAGVQEMARVVAHGGLVGAYAWDMEGGGFPYEPLLAEMRSMGIDVPMPPSPEASRLDVLADLWKRAGLEAIDTCAITVERSFEGFDDYWATVRCGPNVSRQLKGLGAETIQRLEERMRAKLAATAGGRIECSGRAHAVRGRVP